eukprot:CAMPEP_0194116294 /NCGR_PEP_ID=MMETSP0150-20130528/26507_1 /TAXON_ID=122233 /ORGANISM="Chaetoceros debilis, Strain MM31A-1" /LENGTH=574 /DNA_ID=CAMNT_0038806979 /DNA_START=65 /DNA_END=1789 /DNA_ORIENTATION=+
MLEHEESLSNNDGFPEVRARSLGNFEIEDADDDTYEDRDNEELSTFDEDEEKTTLILPLNSNRTKKRGCSKKILQMELSFLLVALITLLIVHVSHPIYYAQRRPVELIGDGGVYSSSDFRNAVTPPYWEEFYNETVNHGMDGGDSSFSVTPHMGPCYLPPSDETNWQELMDENKNINEKSIKYMDGISIDKAHGGGDHQSNLAGFCRPGFIIIGAGKCGTSSLYHYLTGHPRVLPAKSKQIHYFKYFTDRSMKWYLSHFPPTETFLSSGALMTGEASPGYLPYPDVAHRLQSWMKIFANNGQDQPVSQPKIITIVRNPLERSWSSYKYNYVEPMIEKLSKHDTKKNGVPHSDEYYMKNKLFSFEELITAELKQLKLCLVPGGKGEGGALFLAGEKTWVKTLIEERKKKNLPPLVTLDMSCYGGRVSKNVLRQQWQSLTQQHPDKVIEEHNVHLVQSLVGRSLYTFALEWWYALYSKDDLYLFCNEELKNRASSSMSDLSDFLGLPSFDYTEVVSEGMYNVGNNVGYDSVTKWNDEKAGKDEIQISGALRSKYLDFVQPYNDRLFEMTGKRCKWD